MVICALLLSWHNVSAQDDPDSRALQRWEVMLDWIELELSETETLSADFDRYETRLGALIDDAEQLKSQVEQQLETPRLELETLGTPPEEGEPPEASSITAQRDTINEEIATLSQKVKQAELVQVQAEQLLEQLGATTRNTTA